MEDTFERDLNYGGEVRNGRQKERPRGRDRFGGLADPQGSARVSEGQQSHQDGQGQDQIRTQGAL